MMYDYAVQLIKLGKAYVDDQDAKTIKEFRGTLTEHGTNSPFRDRTIEENLILFQNMKGGKYKDGEKVLRAKIDMHSPNMNMRDPVLYRILHAHHHRTKDKWCIYPMYDWAHGLEDSIENITHSICTLEFEDHRPLYDWVLDELKMSSHPQQIEFSRLNLQYTLMSKRKLKQLIDLNVVDGWDDPRLPTIAGLRRRGYTPRSIRDFCRRIGVTKSDNNVELAVLESCIRDDLETRASRVMGIMNPLKIIIKNFPEGSPEMLDAPNHPKDEQMGFRQLPFTRELYIDRDDFREEANRKYKRLVMGEEVRLRYSYVIRAQEIVRDQGGEISELHCTYDPSTLGKNPVDRKVRGVIHWVSATACLQAQIRLFEPLFTVNAPDSSEEGQPESLNADSLKVFEGFVEQSLSSATVDQSFQFEREGYFCLDRKLSTSKRLVFNRVVSLRDTWAKIEQKQD